MNLSKGAIAIPLAATTTLVTGSGLPAAADATTTTWQPPAALAGGTAPACIHRHVHSTLGYVRLSNFCGGTMAVKALVTNNGDSPCFQLGNRKAVLWQWTLGIQSYRRTVVC
jgi:hypothetical protein